MESLKEFKYFDPATKEQIADPEVKLSFDKNGRPAWRNKKGQVTKNPNFWVGAETKGEQDNLSKLPASNALSPNQVLTPGQITNLEKAMKDKEASAAAEKAFQDSQTIVKNLTDSGALQKEVTKAVVNTESIPIFPDDIPRISAAISKALKSATKSGLFSDEYLSSEGEIVSTGRAVNTTADTVVRTVLDSYLSLAKSSDGKDVLIYTLLPEEKPLQESEKKKKRRLLHTREATNDLKKEVTTDAPQSNPSEGQADPSLGDSAKFPVKEPLAQKTESIVIPKQRKKDLETALNSKVTEILSDVLESFKSTATSLRFRCVGVGEPSQAEAKEPEETPNLQPEKPVQETKEPVQKAKEAVHSNDYYIFTRLVEAEEDEEVTTAEDTESDKGVVSEDTDKEPVEKLAKDAAKENKKSGEVKEEAPVFPTTEALKTFIAGLNKAGNPFETDLAVYSLTYTLEDMDASSLSFNILVESKKTTPKEGFWESFGKALKAHLKKTGAQIARDLVGNRGHVN